jgi:hypothetical protein
LSETYSETSLNQPALPGTQKFDRFRGVAGFVGLPLQRIAEQRLKKSADIQGELVF